MKQPHSISRLKNAFSNSMQGLRAAFVREAAFREETLLALLLIVVASCVSVSTVERILLLGSVLIVLIIELLNSSIEKLVDRVSEEVHPLSKYVKDAASASVFLSLVLLVVVWSLIFFG